MTAYWLVHKYSSSSIRWTGNLKSGNVAHVLVIVIIIAQYTTTMRV
jgi:hypothetical protein